jgi:uncharacterized FlaG/YvyC family protein
MASDVPVTTVNTQHVPGGKSPTAATALPSGGKSLPVNGHSAASPTDTKLKAPVKSADKSADPAAAKGSPDLPALVQQLNRHLQNSGRPNQYKLDSSSGRNVIQEINPDTNEVVDEIPATEFKALAQELGISGLLVDTRA